jgi:hypothetical protein
MAMEIIRTRKYVKDLKRMGVSSEDVVTLERTIASNPTAGDLIVGMEGLRKIRFSIGNRGKSGGGRAIYFLHISDSVALMLGAYAKNEKSDLSSSDRKVLLALMKEFIDG